jgi:MFS family permease
VMGLTGALWLLTLRPDPYTLAHETSRRAPDAAPGEPMSRILRRPAVRLAVLAMIAGQVVMISIMTMTPLQMRDHGHDLAAVGFVISAHAAGMFAFSPITGRITQSAGPVPTIGLGLVVLAASAVLAIAAPPDGGFILLAALFLLGYGWNLCFVAGSALVMSGVEHVERTRTQGVTDTLVWGSSAVASLASGLVLAAAGFAALGLVSVVLVAVVALAVLRLGPVVLRAGRVSSESAAS